MISKTFRLFVSSTFSDLREERNALARFVFPKLERLCESRGYRFQAVDLRWGVRDESAADQRTVRICLDEIARCQERSAKPNFIVLLGDRYGWRPAPSEVPAGEMEALIPGLAPDEAALIRDWYWRDDNANPPAYVLQPRRDGFRIPSTWESVERRLRAILARGGHTPSATEMEIVEGSLKVADADQHVFAFLRAIPNLGEVAAALPDAGAAELLDTNPDGSWDEAAWTTLGQLKQSLIRKLGNNVFAYSAPWTNGRLSLDRIGGEVDGPSSPEDPDETDENLCRAVWTRLSGVLRRQMDDLDLKMMDPLDRERQVHAGFAMERSQGFVGQAEPLRRIFRYLASITGKPLLIHGGSGSGKSSLMAKAVEEARVGFPHGVVISRFIGADHGTADIRPLLHGLTREMNRALGGDEKSIPADYAKLAIEFLGRMRLARSDRPLLLFLDAVDQLGDSDSGRELTWLPRELPPHVRLVVSVLSDGSSPCFPLLAESLPPEIQVPVERLTSEDGGKLLDESLGRVGRSLSGGQRAIILGRFDRIGSPLYMKLAIEEARRWRSFDGDDVASGLPADVPGMIGMLFRRLEAEHGAVAPRALGYLAAARIGLSEHEILDLLWRDARVKEDFTANARHELPQGQEALPPVIWSRLRFDLAPYLSERETIGARCFSLFHRQLAISIGGDHGGLAGYFQEQGDFLALGIPNARKAAELPYQLHAVEDNFRLLELLTQPNFIQAKCATPGLGIDDLLLDFDRVSGVTGSDSGQRTSFHALHVELWQEASVLRRNPELALQQAWKRWKWLEELPATSRNRFAAAIVDHVGQGHAFLSPEIPIHWQTHPMQTLVLEGGESTTMVPHLDGLLVLGPEGDWHRVSPSGSLTARGKRTIGRFRLAVSCAGAVAILGDSDLAYYRDWYSDDPFRFRTAWETASLGLGRNGLRLLAAGKRGEWSIFDWTGATFTKSLLGSIGEPAYAAALAPDGTFGVIGTQAGTIHFVGRENAAAIRRPSLIRALRVSPTGSTIASIEGNGSLSLLDTQGGILLHLEPEFQATDASFGPDGTLFCLTSDGAGHRFIPKEGRWVRQWEFSGSRNTLRITAFGLKPSLALMESDGVVRISNPDLGPSAAKTVERPSPFPEAVIVGFLSRAGQERIIADKSGKFWSLERGPVPAIRFISDFSREILGFHPIGNSEGLLIYKERPHIRYARILLDPHFAIQGIQASGNVLGTEEVQFRSAHFSPKGRYFMQRSQIVDAKAREVLEVFRTDTLEKIQEMELSSRYSVTAISDSGLIFSGYPAIVARQSTVHALDGKLLGRFPIPSILDACFDSDGSGLVIRDGKDNAHFVGPPWDLPAINPIGSGIGIAKLSPDGQMAALIGLDGMIHVLDMRAQEAEKPNILARIFMDSHFDECRFDGEVESIYLHGKTGFQFLGWEKAP